MKVRVTIQYKNGQLSSTVVDHNHFGIGNYTTMIRLGANLIPISLTRTIEITPILDLPTKVGEVDEVATAMLPIQPQQGS